MTALDMPIERRYGWQLKPTSSTFFEVVRKPNGQLCVVLNHSLLRGCTSEMIHWWFLHFPSLKVKLLDTEGYENSTVPAYFLWHPSDHYDVSLRGHLGPGHTSRADASIHIQEAMQFLTYGWKYPVDSQMKIFYCDPDGWAMGKAVPILGKAMVLRIHFRDVREAGRIVGVHYHYEIVVGVGGNHPIAKFINSKITGHFVPEFFQAWHLHNTVEVGTFENFLPALYAQRGDLPSLTYSKDMNSISDGELPQSGHDHTLFKERVQGYKDATNVHEFQAWNLPSFLS